MEMWLILIAFVSYVYFENSHFSFAVENVGSDDDWKEEQNSLLGLLAKGPHCSLVFIETFKQTAETLQSGVREGKYLLC